MEKILTRTLSGARGGRSSAGGAPPNPTGRQPRTDNPLTHGPRRHPGGAVGRAPGRLRGTGRDGSRCHLRDGASRAQGERPPPPRDAGAGATLMTLQSRSPRPQRPPEAGGAVGLTGLRRRRTARGSRVSGRALPRRGCAAGTAGAPSAGETSPCSTGTGVRPRNGSPQQGSSLQGEQGRRGNGRDAAADRA